MLGLTVSIPRPGLLLEMKRQSYAERAGEARQVKDALDILALVAYAGVVPGRREREFVRDMLRPGTEEEAAATELLGGTEPLKMMRMATRPPDVA